MAKKVQEIRFKTGTEVWFQGKLVKVIAIHFSGNRFVGYTVGDPCDPLHGEHAEQDELKAKDELLTLDGFEGLINEMEFGKKTRVYLVQNPVFRDLRIESTEKDLGKAGVAITAAENAIRKAIKGAGYIRQIAKYAAAREYAIFLKDGKGERTEKDANKHLYVATVIDHGETCDGHVRKLAQGTIDECKKEIEEDKKLFLKRIPRGCTKCVKPNEVWIYPKDGENNYTDGRIYDVIEITLPKAN